MGLGRWLRGFFNSALKDGGGAFSRASWLEIHYVGELWLQSLVLTELSLDCT